MKKERCISHVRNYLPREDFTSYEDFKANYRLNIPADFNFAYDVIDEWAKQDPQKPALVRVDDFDAEERLTFHDLMERSMRRPTTINPSA